MVYAVILLAASLTTWLSVVSALFVAVAAVAAVIALHFAHETVNKSEAARGEAAIQHSEQMDGMKALTDSMRTATAAAAKREQTETEHRQIAQVQGIVELLLQIREAADAEAESPPPPGAPSRLPLLLEMICTAKNAWLATADLELNRNPQAAALVAFRPDLMDADNPRDVSRKCDLAVMAINASWGTAMVKHAALKLEQPLAVIELTNEVQKAGGLPRYLLKLLACEGPKTEADLIAAVHTFPNFDHLTPEWLANASKNGLIKAVVPDGGVIERWHITDAGRTASRIPTDRPH
jgi:hypothetical protein